MSAFQNGHLVKSENPLVCPKCKLMKTQIVIGRAGGARCIDCHRLEDTLQEMFEQALDEEWATISREARILKFQDELRQFREQRRTERALSSRMAKRGR